jgi:acid phosphatase type 7
MKRFSVATALFLGIAVHLASEVSVAQIIYLTWNEEDTSHSMSVVSHTPAGASDVQVHYGPQRKTKPTDFPNHQLSVSELIPGTNRRVHYAHLKGLQPGTEYHFMVTGASAQGGTARLLSNAVLKFKTIAESGPLKFVVGGDMDIGPEVDQISKLAAKTDPEFALIGGDIAYDDGLPINLKKWDVWLDSWTKHMVTSHGHMVPIVAAIGNHEVVGGTSGSVAKAPFYFGIFNQTPDKKSYFTRRFGKDLVLYSLDTGHIAPHGGPQTQWLEKEMVRTVDAPVKLAMYHIPLYPSVRKFEDPKSAHGRKFWGPVFEKLGLTTGLENHDHALKRTKFIQGGRLDNRTNPADPKGVVYIGDGCWGKEFRPVDPTRDYLAVAQSTRHFWAARLDDKTFEMVAVDSQGGVVDRMVLNRRFLNAKKDYLTRVLRKFRK